MTDFDLDAAKKGMPVCTKGGNKVRILTFDRETDDDYSIVSLANQSGREMVICYKKNGKYFDDGGDSPFDLMMAYDKKVGWINVYPLGCADKFVTDKGVAETSGILFKTEEMAKKCAGEDCIGCVRVEFVG